jgi:hypothetical protein
MNVDALAPLDDLQRMVRGRRLVGETRLGIADVVDPDEDGDVGEQPIVPGQAEAQPIPTDHQLGRREQDPKSFATGRGGLGRHHRAHPVVDEARAAQERRGDRAENVPRHYSTMTCPYIQGWGRQM